ncbi:MarR family winged helix-turn-helix transcriptional regulator [Brevundimonas sp.]|uniref:MarR family winged helix-turn-helix transcriptional regulator n=1 Tax=Brevundimonas sp. TaxID=1871086 RepID=UPI003AF428C2
MVFELSLVGDAPEIVGALIALLRTSRPILRSEDDPRIRLLSHIRASGRRGASQASTARKLGMSDAGLSRLCDELEHSTMIQRIPHPHDRRIKMLHLTPEGEDQVRACAGACETHIADFVRTLTSEEQALLSRLVARATDVPVRTSTCAGCRVGGC